VVVSGGEARTFSEAALLLSPKYKKIFSFLFLHLDPAGYERTAQAAESNFCELGLPLRVTFRTVGLQTSNSSDLRCEDSLSQKLTNFGTDIQLKS